MKSADIDIYKRAIVILILTGFFSPVHIFAYEDNGTAAPMPPPENNQVWKIYINGNETFKDIVLKNQIATEAPTFWDKISFWSRAGHAVNETDIMKDAERLRGYYRRRGFTEVDVEYRLETGSKEWKKHLYFEIDENAPLIIRNVQYQIDTKDRYREYILANSNFERVQRKHSFQPGSRYEIIKEPDVIGMFTNVLKNLGFAYTNVETSTKIDTTAHRVDVTITCIPGPMTYFDQIRVEGNKSVDKSLVVKESGLKQGNLFSLDRLEAGQLELFNHHLYRFATISIPEQEQDSTLDLQVTVRENSLRSIQTLFGVGTEDIVRGQVSWKHRNVFKKANRFSATGRASFIEQSADLDYLVPYVFNTRSSVVFSPFIQHLIEQNIYELFRGGITNSFIYQYREYLTGTASYQFTRNRELSKRLNVSLPDSTLRYNLSSFQLTGFYSPGYERQQAGWVIQPNAEFSGFFGAASFSFQKYSINLRKYTRLSQSTTLATRINAGGLYGVARDSLPRNIRFFLGGTSSVRGWSRQELGPKRARVDSTGRFIEYVPIGGRAMLGMNVEIRQEVNSFINGLGVAVFVDGGQVWRGPEELGSRPIQYALGGGLRYRSPIGPVRIDVGYKLNPTDKDLNIFNGENFGNSFDRIGIHFSVGQAF